MHSQNKIIIGIVALLILIGGGILLMKKEKERFDTYYNIHNNTNTNKNNNTSMTNFKEEQSNEKHEITTAILHRQQVFSSDNVSEIRSYISKYRASNPEELKRISALSDSDLINELKFTATAKFVTEEELQSPETKWEIAPDHAKITINIGNPAENKVNKVQSYLYIYAYKTNGKWY